MKLIKLLAIVFLWLNHVAIGQSFTAFTGATIIDGRGGTPLKNAVLLIRGNRIVAVGEKEKITIPSGATVKDLGGKVIVPGIINGHGHVGDVKGIEGGHYSLQTNLDNLALYARYGITTVVSLGGERKDAVALRAIHDTNTTQRARLYIAGDVITGNTPGSAVAVVEKNHQMGVDFMKIRVDDQLGTTTKMPEDVYRAVIKRSHELGYKIATHMYALDDAKKLLDAGSDLLAHSVRDVAIDESFIKLIKEKKVAYCPTLTRELSTFVYADTPEFFSDPFFTKEIDSIIIKPLKDPARQQQVRNSRSAQTYKQQLPVAMANLKKLSDNGVPIVFGTDSGVPTRFMGYFEHLEMEMMAQAGLTPMQIIVSATKNAAQYLDLKNVGSLIAGNWADFIILDADPLQDIRNMRKIAAVFISGEEVIQK
jgi:imidazolonepropionase-like amidohydrolase